MCPLIGEAKDATITRTGDGFQIEEETVGVAIDLEATKAALAAALTESAGTDGITVEAVVTESQPKVTAEQLATIGDVLGTFSTSFNAGNSSRTKNLKTGTEKINGTVLMPGRSSPPMCG